MTAIRTRLAALGFVLAAMVALTGCVISSATNLIDVAELVTPLPPTFTMYPFKQGPGGFIPADDKPGSFTLEGQTYVVSDRSMTLQFNLLTADTYLLAVGGEEPGTMYGTLTYTGGVAAIRLLLASDTAGAVDTLKAEAPADISGDLDYRQDGLTITTRATLDFVIGKVIAGELPTETLVAYIGPADATLPALIEETDGQFTARR